MVWAGVSASGCTPLVFVPKGVKINTVAYVDGILKPHLLPWPQSHFSQKSWTCQQNRAPVHKSKKTQEWCPRAPARFHSCSRVAGQLSQSESHGLLGVGILDNNAWAKDHTSAELLKTSLE